MKNIALGFLVAALLLLGGVTGVAEEVHLLWEVPFGIGMHECANLVSANAGIALASDFSWLLQKQGDEAVPLWGLSLAHTNFQFSDGLLKRIALSTANAPVETALNRSADGTLFFAASPTSGPLLDTIDAYMQLVARFAQAHGAEPLLAIQSGQSDRIYQDYVFPTAQIDRDVILHVLTHASYARVYAYFDNISLMILQNSTGTVDPYVTITVTYRDSVYEIRDAFFYEYDY